MVVGVILPAPVDVVVDAAETVEEIVLGHVREVVALVVLEAVLVELYL